MQVNITSLVIDFLKPYYTTNNGSRELIYKKGDYDSDGIEVEMLNYGIDDLATTNGQCNILAPDGTEYTSPIVITDTGAKFKLDTSQVGKYKFELRLQDGDNVTFSSTFTYTVLQSIMDNPGQALPNLPTLQDLVDDLRQAEPLYTNTGSDYSPTTGARILVGSTTPSGPIKGDVWLKL